ncbi:1674_t:CDS:2 [Entrophospora sp. SA101]|nr:1674_t:CDS:2 [Entrophospora sp. SA101]
MIVFINILKALREFRDPESCCYNGYREDPKLNNESLGIKPFVDVGERLPFTGRNEELGHLVKFIHKNLDTWCYSYKSRYTPNNDQNILNEYWKREYQHPTVADGPGRGIAGAQTVLALRILHQSINGNLNYAEFISDLKVTLGQHHIKFEDITLEAVLEHICVLPPSISLPYMVLLHLSETNSLLKKSPYESLQLLMKAALLRAFNSNDILTENFNEFNVTEHFLVTLTNSGHFLAALADCGDNVRLFSLMVYVIGCYDDKSHLFSWNRLFEILLKLSDYASKVEHWINTVHYLVTTSFPKYTTCLLQLDTHCLMHVLTPALLGDPIDMNPSSEIMKSGITWEDLEKDGAISLISNKELISIELPFMFIQLYLGHPHNDKNPLISFIHLLNHLNDKSNWRQNEKCDIAMVALWLLNWHFNHPTHTVFALKEVVPNLYGPVSDKNLRLPQAIQQLNLLAYIGAGNETFADSWFVFKHSNDDGDFENMAVNKNVVVLGLESKSCAKEEALYANYSNLHKNKVKRKLPKGTPLVFMMIADMKGDNIIAEEDEIIIVSENIEKLYGPWLAQHHQFALSNKIYK